MNEGSTEPSGQYHDPGAQTGPSGPPATGHRATRHPDDPPGTGTGADTGKSDPDPDEYEPV